MKTALITGIGGQDGSWLAEHLLSLGYRVHGIARSFCNENIMPQPGLTIHIGDMRDKLSLESAFRKAWPDEVYNLAGQVFVPTGWTQTEETFNVNVGGLARLLGIIWELKRDTRIFQASSSDMFGDQSGIVNEKSQMIPVSPYGVSKHAAHELMRVYRQRGLFTSTAILFPHEGPRRGQHMVTRKITRHVARWVCGERVTLELGDMNVTRDWGNAADYVRAMHLSLQQDAGDDYVIATEVRHSIREFLLTAIVEAGLKWDGVMGLVTTSDAFSRGANEIGSYIANCSKARRVLGWTPTTSFTQLVRSMVDRDVELCREWGDSLAKRQAQGWAKAEMDMFRLEKEGNIHTRRLQEPL